MTIANDVLATRVRLGWTQQQLADALSDGDRRVSERTVGSWELGSREPAPYLKYVLAWIEQEHEQPHKPGPRAKKRRR